MPKHADSARAEVQSRKVRAPNSLRGPLCQQRFVLAAYLLTLMSVVVAFALRLHLLGEANIWYDEGLSFWASQQDLVSASRYTARDVHPPLYFWLLHHWLRLAGQTEFAGRFFSAAAGTLTVAAVFRLGSSIATPSVGALAAAFLAISRFHIWWSQEARMYILAALMSTLALWLFVRWWRGEGRLWPYVLAATAGLYTLYLTVVVVIATNLVTVFGLWRQASYRTVWRWIAAQAAILALFSPWLYLALTSMQSWSIASPTPLVDFISIYWTILLLGVSTHVEPLRLYVLAAAAVSLGFALWALWRPGRLSRSGLALLLLVLLLPIGLVYLLTLPRALFYAPTLSARYFLLAQPALVVLLAVGAYLLRRRWLPLSTVAVAVIVLSSLWSISGHYADRAHQDNYHTIVRAIALHSRPGEALLLHNDANWPVFMYYYARYHLTLPIERIPYAAAMDEAQAEHYLGHVWDRADGLWVVVNRESLSNDPGRAVETWLSAQAAATLQLAGNGTRLLYFGKGSKPDLEVAEAWRVNPTWPISQPEGGAVGLIGYDRPVSRVKAGQPLPLTLYWRPDARLASPVRLLSERAGHSALLAIFEAPSEPNGGPYLAVQRLAPRIPASLDSGLYGLYLEAPAAGALSLHRLSLGQIEVLPRPPTSALVDIENPLSARLGEQIELIGYQTSPSLSTGLRPGEELRLVLYWRTHGPVDLSYTVFTQLLGDHINPSSGNTVWGQHDGEPGGGQMPTSLWIEGETVVDEHILILDQRAQPGSYLLQVGMYDPTTGTRLHLVDEAGKEVDDRVMLGTVTVPGEDQKAGAP